jgi:flagellar assembly protein FliH
MKDKFSFPAAAAVMASFNEGRAGLIRPATDDGNRLIKRAERLRDALPFRLRTLEAFATDPSSAAVQPDSLDSILQQRYRDGFEEGQRIAEHRALQASDQESRRLGKTLGQRVQALTESFEREFCQQEEAIADSLTGLAIELAQQLVASHIKLDRHAALGLVRECLALLPRPARACRLAMNPADLEFLRASLVAELAAYEIELVADASIQAGGCHLTNDQMTLDSSLPSRWQNAISAIGALVRLPN